MNLHTGNAGLGCTSAYSSNIREKKKSRKQSQSKMLIDSSSVTIQYHRQLQHDTFSEIAYTKASQTFFENWDGGWPNG